MTETKNPLPPRSAIEKTFAENKTCPKSIEDKNCNKPTVSGDMEFYSGIWVVFFTCEDGHRWYDPIVKPDNPSNVGP